MRGFDLRLQQSKLVPVDGRLQGVVLPLAICSAVELAGSIQAVAGLASFRDVVERVSA